MYEGAQLFLDRFEYSTAYGAVQRLSKIANGLSSGASVCALLASFVIAFLHSDRSVPGEPPCEIRHSAYRHLPICPSAHRPTRPTNYILPFFACSGIYLGAGFTLVAQLYIANAITQTLPISDDSQSGPILLARIALYVCLVSVLTGLIYTTAERYKQLHAFVGGLSPYAILYTAGKCIGRLDKPSDALLAQIVSVMYSFARLWYRTGTPPDASDGVFARVWVNLDFLADRLLVLAFGRYVQASGGNSALPLCVMYILGLVLLDRFLVRWKENPLCKSLINLLNVMLAQKMNTTMTYRNVSFVIFATGALLCRLFQLPMYWLTQLAWIGLCLSVVQYIESFIAAEASNVSTSISIYCFVFVGLAVLYPRRPASQSAADHVLTHATAPAGVPVDG